jgi:hypothetical protein
VIRYDPYQLYKSMMGLHGEGLPCEEFPQTSGNLTRAGQVVFDLLTGKNIRLYPSVELRTQALHTVSTESSRGWKIAKEKVSAKIDAIVALSPDCVAALDQGNAMVVALTTQERQEALQEAARGRPRPRAILSDG